MKSFKSFKSSNDCQPPEWENFLKDVTSETNLNELTFDPEFLGNLKNTFQLQDFESCMDLVSTDADEKIKILLRIAQKKLSGNVQKCFQIILTTGKGPRQIGQELGFSEDTVQRYLKKAIEICKKNIQSKPGSFALPKGTKYTIRAISFPIDTEEEQITFLDFINSNAVLHISYHVDNFLREVLILYLSGKRNFLRKNH